MDEHPIATPSPIHQHPATPVPAPTPNERAQAALRDIRTVLTHHDCRIVPYLLPPEQVGSGHPTRVLMEAAFGIVPNVS